MSQQDISAVSPALERYEQALFRDVWTRAGLSQRDRSVITLAALITRGQIGQLAFYTNYTLEHGVTRLCCTNARQRRVSRGSGKLPR